MNLKLISIIGRRFARSSSRRGFLNFARSVAFISVLLGAASLVISLSVLDGFDYKLRQNAVKFTSQIQIHKLNEETLNSFPMVINVLKKNFPAIKTIDPVIERQSIIRSKSTIEGIQVKGIEPGYDIGDIRSNVSEGSLDFSNHEAKEIVIGKTLAQKLNVIPGDKIVLFSIESISNIRIFRLI